MKHTILLLFFLFFFSYASAIKPSRTYSLTPEMLRLKYEEISVKTDDGAVINVWHLPSDSLSIPIIISESDAGNMSNWIYLGTYLQAFGYDVWMYDYRGFGKSSDFSIKQSQLFYKEFATDLSFVTRFVYEKTTVPPVLMGLSMGTIIVNEYLRNASVPVQMLIFDGFVRNPFEWIERLEKKGKVVFLPNDYTYEQYDYSNKSILFITSEQDDFSLKGDIATLELQNIVIQNFNCGHLAAFASFPQEYLDTIYSFINGHENKTETICGNTNIKK